VAGINDHLLFFVWCMCNQTNEWLFHMNNHSILDTIYNFIKALSKNDDVALSIKYLTIGYECRVNILLAECCIKLYNI
jgi:hypothetical protein